MTVILVFGADGQLGHELSARAARAGTSLFGVRRAEADITNAEAVASVIARKSPSIVVNAAAYTKVDRAETEVDEAYRANATGPAVLAAACAAARLPLLHISTDYVFDGTKPTAYVEDDPIAPLGVYGQSKAAGETSVRDALERHVILRTAWVYGVYGANFLKTMVRLAAERDELRVVADQRGCPTGTADIADAILSIAPRLARHDRLWGTYHFVGHGATTWYGFANEIVDAQAKFTNRRPRVVPITTAEFPTPAKRPANSELDTSRFIATFGFEAADWRQRTREVVSNLLSANQSGGAR
jgi:dTDP-4-dehydrorhamnose reductase